MRRFDPGEAVALREVWHGRVWAARAATIVEDSAEQATFFIPAGTPWVGAVREGTSLRIPQDDFDLAVQGRHDADAISFAWPDVAHAAILSFRVPLGWYVNLQEPLRRSEVGFDTVDHELDVVVELDGTWRWKDEDEMAEAIARGVLPPDAEPRLRAEGEGAVRRILAREPPFDRDWTTWRPDPRWQPPELPEGWDRV